jgi:hypothetical protein
MYSLTDLSKPRAIHKSRAEDISVYGSEKEKWAHNPILHPLRWLKDPYYLEEKHYHDRPYPVASPAFTNVPLIGPLLAATIGRFIKPTVRMHEEEWNGENYSLYSTRIEPKGPNALPPPTPKDEYSLGNVMGKEAGIFAEYTRSLRPDGRKAPRANAVSQPRLSLPTPS